MFLSHDTTTTDIYTLSLHDALPISTTKQLVHAPRAGRRLRHGVVGVGRARSTKQERTKKGAVRLAAPPPHRTGEREAQHGERSEEHTSELQSQFHLVCRLLLEKKKK